MNKTIYALGFFDGVHAGHQALLKECCRLAAETGCDTGAITFRDHPDALVFGAPPVLINTGQLLLNYCRAAGLPGAVVPEQTVDGTRVSSTHIRTLLEQGSMEEANRFLGHPQMLTGTVVHGRHLGSTLGIPTANLPYPDGLVVPRKGVYAARVCLGGTRYPAVTNVGTRPTVSGKNLNVESWILGYDGDLYEKEITVEFLKFLRPERKFDSLEQMKAEIQKNARETLEFLNASN